MDAHIEPKTLTITVSGPTGSGKTALAELIRGQLALAGIAVTCLDDNGIGIVEQEPGMATLSLPSRIDALRTRGNRVHVQTLMTARARSS